MSKNKLTEMIDESFQSLKEGKMIKSRVLDIKPQVVIVDIGYKSEGIIPISEFEDEEIQIGDEIEVLLERLEDDEGLITLSKEKAAHKQNWKKIMQVHKEGNLIRGKVKSVVKGGLMVNVGTEAFLPGSQIDITPSKNLNDYVNKIYEFKIIKVNDERKNIVLSRREVIESELEEQRQKFLENVKVGSVVKGIVKNITDFGVLMDLNGMDGLLHITDMSWGRVSHPKELVTFGEEIEVIITDIDVEKKRVSLGLKQLQPNPWKNIEERYPIGQRVKGNVRKIVQIGRASCRERVCMFV